MAVENPRAGEIGPRRAELNKLTKREVLDIYRRVVNPAWTASSPARWTKDELVAEIVWKEIGPRELCGQRHPSGRICTIGATEHHSIHRYDPDPSEVNQ